MKSPVQGDSIAPLTRFSAWCSVTCVSILLLLVPFAWWPKDLYGLIKWVVIDIAVIVAVSVWLASSFFEGVFTFRRNALNLPLALFIFWSSLSLWMGPDRYYVVKRMHELLLLGLLYLSLTFSLTTRGRRIFLSAAALSGLTAISVLGIAHYFGFFPVESPWGGGLGRRVYATMLNPNFLADFIVGLFPLALCFFIFSCRRKAVAALAAIVMLVSFLCLLFTVSWGGLLGWSLSVVVCISLAFGKRREHVQAERLVAILLVLVLMGGVFLAMNKGTVAADYSGMKYRVLYWRASLRMIEERPLFGFGLNSFQPYIPRYLTEVISSDMKSGVFDRKGYVTVYEGVYAHDEYLAIWIELGIVGLLLFLWLVIRFYLQARRNLSMDPSEEEIAIQVGAMCGIAALLAQSIFNYPLRVPASTVSIALLLAFVGSGSSSRARSFHLSMVPGSVRGILALLLLLCAAFLIPRTARPLIGERLYVEARYASYRKDWPAVRERCRAALDYPVTEPEMFDLLGETEERLGLFADAIWDFQRKLDLKPFDSYAHLKLGALYDRLGMERQAVSHLEEAIALERHDSAEGRERLAEILGRHGRWDEAVRLLKEDLPHHGREWMLRNSLGIAYAVRGDRESAAREFLAVKELGGGDVAGYNMRVLRSRAESKNGPGQMESLLIGPSGNDWVNARIERGREAVRRGAYEVAGQDFQSVLGRYPDYVPAMSNMGIYYLKTGQADRATVTWDAARRIDPGFTIEIPR
ncbi:MAG: O-antigen ligase family protein [Candidatus Aureabacteria bacterium]|nr:O-antigen ligase family protein [Candidatus Auribacterota bacterium]